MADGVVAVSPSTAATAVDIDNSAFGSTTFRQRVVIGGDSSAQLLSPTTAAPSSGDYSIPVRLNAGSTTYILGAVVGSSLSVTTVYSSSSSPHVVLLSTAAGSSYLDPRNVNLIAAGSSINIGVVPAGSSSYALGQVYGSSAQTWVTQLTTTPNGSYIDPRQATLIAAGSSINIGVVPAGSSSYALGVVWQGSTFVVNLVAAGSSINVGVVPAGSSSYALGTVYGASSQTWITQLSTAPNGAYLDPRDRNWTLSTAERLTVGAAGSSINIGMVAAGSSSYQVGTVYLGSGSTANVLGGVALLGGTTANSVGSVALLAGSSANIIGSVANVAATTGILIGAVALSSAGVTRVYGDVSTGSTAGENPVGMGGRAATTNPTAAADGGRAYMMTDDVGRQVVISGGVRDLVFSTGVTISSTAEASFVSAGGAGVFRDITFLILSNASTSAGVNVQIASSSGGATLFNVHLAAEGGAVLPFNPPLPQATANSNWTAKASAAGTLYIDTIGVNNV